jgi:formylglycine-generating enzyme required for sulfatase activity
MTELEYEKACRGSQQAVANEYAWGSTVLWQAKTIVGDEAGNAVVMGNCSYGAPVMSGGDGGSGPVDAAAFRAPSSATSITLPPDVAQLPEELHFSEARPIMGAAASGALGMSGNLWEMCVSVGSPDGLKFKGTHGNGDAGRPYPKDWPTPFDKGFGFRGGSWFVQATDVPNQLCVADRTVATTTYYERSHDVGFRCALSFDMFGPPLELKR